MSILLRTNLDGRAEFCGLPQYFKTSDVCVWESEDGQVYEIDFAPAGAMDRDNIVIDGGDSPSTVVLQGEGKNSSITITVKSKGGPTVPVGPQ